MSSISANTSSLSQGANQVQRHAHHRHGPGGAAFKQAFEGAAKDLGLDASKADDLRQQIDAAVKGAGTRDKDAVRAAIDTVLSNNGIDAAKFHEAMKAQFDKVREQRPARGSGTARQCSGSNDQETTASPQAAQQSSAGGIDTIA